MSESVPLLRSSVRRRCYRAYRFQFIHSKGALLVLLWDLLIGISLNLLIQTSDPSFADFISMVVVVGVSSVLIFAGFLGDFLISRYKFIIVGSYISFFLLIPLLIIMILQQSFYLLLILKILYSLLVISVCIVRVSLLPFNIDQLIGSSSDELTAVIHWHNIGPVIYLLFGQMIFSLKNTMLQELIIFLLCIVCFAAILVSHSLFNHHLDKTPVNTTNPIKLIVRVLCYARKHKYPENRSALTYWEEEAPSRLDLGMDKYGGPFTEEEVEDVKTILKLLPILIVNGLAVSFNGDFVVDTNRKYYGCLELHEGNIIGGVYVFIILLHQFLIYPCFYNYIPSMLKRIGLGMGLIVAVNFAYTVLAFIGNYRIGDSFHCLTVLDQKSVTITHSWYIFSDAIVGVFLYINNVVLVEFIIAQCPKSMRGTIVGLWLCLRILRAYIGLLLFLPFLHYLRSGFSLGRGFYFFLSRDILCVIAFAIFAFLAKCYKFRVRENEINIHVIAEDHIIRNIEQDEESRRMEHDYTSNIVITECS